MNYEERYKQAIEAAKRELHCCGSLDCDAARQIFRLFPELRESEDEKIRKEIIQSIQDNMCVIHKDKCLAWLEKQGKQKPAWSEEDIEIIKMIEDCLSFYKMTHCVTLPSVETCIEWLKSIKPNHWKPSEEQMSMLLAVLNDSNNITAESVYIALKSLYNDLKKL